MNEFSQSWDIWSPDRERISKKEPQDFKKISLCMSLFNRSRDLKKTLVKNVEDCSSYPNFEIVVLDCFNDPSTRRVFSSSKVKYLVSMGLVKYSSTSGHTHNHPALFRNLAFAQASGSVVFNLEPEVFVGQGFLEFVNRICHRFPERVVFAKTQSESSGRIGFYKKDFAEIGGFDERLSGYGFHDQDILIRAMTLGFKLVEFGIHGPNSSMRKMPIPKSELSALCPNPNYKETERKNRVISLSSISSGRLVANNECERPAVMPVKFF